MKDKARKRIFMGLFAGLIAAGLVCLLTACGGEQRPEETPGIDLLAELKADESVPAIDTTVTVSSNGMGLKLQTPLKFEWAELFREDYSRFDPLLAKFSLLMCLDAQDNGRAAVTDAPKGSESDDSAFPASLGFGKTQRFLIGANAEENPDDTTSMVVSAFTYLREDRHISYINVSFTGTDGSNGQWASNFDIGAEGSVYPGASEEWRVKANHKGFDVTATRALAQLKSCFQTLELAGADRAVVGINGYSRGAAVANIVAARFFDAGLELSPNTAVYAYTFAAPNTTTETAAEGSCIFNLINAGDVVPSLPPESMGFSRYGQDLVFDLSSDQALSSRYTQLTGSKYSSTGLRRLRSGLQALCADRTAYYTVGTDADSTNTLRFMSRSQAAVQRESVRKQLMAFCPEHFDDYVSLGEVIREADGSFSFSYSLAPAFISAAIPALLKKVGSGMNLTSLLPTLSLVSYGRFSSLVLAVAEVFVAEGDVIRDMHDPAAYFLYIDSLS